MKTSMSQALMLPGEGEWGSCFFVFACVLPTKIVRVAAPVVVFRDLFVCTTRKRLESLADVS